MPVHLDGCTLFETDIHLFNNPDKPFGLHLFVPVKLDSCVLFNIPDAAPWGAKHADARYTRA